MRTLVVLFLLFFGLSISLSGQEIRFKEKSRPGKHNVIRITNNGEQAVNIADELDAYFFLNDSSIIEFISKMEVPQVLDTDYRRAWQFMVNFTWSARRPLADRSLTNNGLEFINSLGWGYCGIKSQMLDWIWGLMGYRSRVVDLGGHIVPEIFIKDHWEVWDPTYHVFYTGPNGQPLGVDSLSQHPEFVAHPISTYGLKKTFWMNMMGYSQNLAEIYASVENNIILKKEIADSKAEKTLTFLLPPKSSLIFPVYSGLPLISDYHGKLTRLFDYAECALYIPPGITGDIQIPLVFHGASSQLASLRIGQDNLVINETQDYFITTGYPGQDGIVVTDNKSGVWLYYLVNPRLADRFSGLLTLKTMDEKDTVKPGYVKPKARYRVNVILLEDIQQGVRTGKFSKAFFRWMRLKN